MIQAAINNLIVINQTLIMRKAKNKTTGKLYKNTPYHINIQLNINPKNITHHQEHAEMKISQNMYPQNSTNLSKNKAKTSKRSAGDFTTVQGVDRDGKKKDIDLSGGECLNNKQLQKLKKNLIGKINNMDIVLAAPTIDQQVSKEDSDSKSDSLMSAKMMGYQLVQDKFIVKPTGIKLNEQNIKSKVMNSQQYSKILGCENNKKQKSQFRTIQKKGLSKTIGKSVGHQRAFSNFTESKSQQYRNNKKVRLSLQAQGQKSDRQKQINLRQKLQRFKRDMMKLVNYYQQSQVLKTKLSSQYYQMRSRQVSKDIVQQNKVTQGQEHEKLQQIKQFLTNSIDLNVQSQEFIRLKQLYNQFRQNNYNEFEDNPKECTQNLVKHYLQILSNQVNPQCHERMQQQSSPLNLLSSIKPVQVDQQNQNSKNSELNQQKISDQRAKIQQFMNYLCKNIPDKHIKDNINKIYSQFISKDTLQLDHQSIHQISSQPPIHQLSYENIDCQVNNQITLLPFMIGKIANQYQLNNNQSIELENWQNSYKDQLLRIKGKMWKEYTNIRSVIQNRIVQNTNYKPIETMKCKKHKKIMKCLSEKIININSNCLKNQTNFQSKEQWKKNCLKKQKQPDYLRRQLDDKHIPTIDQDSENESDQSQLINSEVIFSPFSNKIQKHEILSKINQFIQQEQVILKRSQKQKKIVHQQNKKDNQAIKIEIPITDQDKDDIFEFIFLDLCIELYQDAIETDRSAFRSEKEKEASDRIMNKIRDFLKEEKKRKKIIQSKKIGISTSYNTVKILCQKMVSFLISDIKMDGFQTNKQRVLSKLNTPLGPNQLQILKSLRLSVDDNQTFQDYNQQLQEDNSLLILQADFFLYFQNQIVKIKELQFNRYYDSQERDQQRVNFLRNSTHIHSKSIFDCLNECLDDKRIYGIWGKPFTWKKCANFSKNRKQQQIPQIFKEAVSEVLKSATYACGLMVNKEESLIKDLSVESQYLQQLQDQRIYKLLQNYVTQIEGKWFFHDDQLVEILMQVSHLVWTILIKEVLIEIKEYKL